VQQWVSFIPELTDKNEKRNVVKKESESYNRVDNFDTHGEEEIRT
jgi:hypothetical protein